MTANLSPGELVDRYQIEASIGEGGMARVFRVRHTELGTLHAMKVLTLGRADLAERMLQEGRIQARLRHPNVVAVQDVVRVGGAPALVMELIDGPALDSLLRHYQPNEAQCDALARGIIAGVRAAHAAGLVHRDLKPANVMLALEDGRVVPKVTDFGLARLLDTDPDERKTRSGATLGTPTFMAPEQLRNAANADQRADIFALGAILYELVTGIPAFSGDDLIAIWQASSTESYRPVRSVRPNAPERMERAIVGALRAKPEDRWADCAALLAAWEEGAPPVGGSAWEPFHVELVRSLAPSAARPGGDTVDASLAAGPPPQAPQGAQPTLVADSLGGSLFDGSGADAPENPRRPWLPLLAIALIGGPILGAGAGLALWWAAAPAPDFAETVAASAPSPEPPPTRDTASPGGEAAPADATSAPAPVASPRAKPAQVVKVPETTAPERVIVPAPPPGEAATEPVATPPAAKPSTSWSVQGVDRAYLVDAAGHQHPPGGVAPGTYRLFAFFEPTKATSVAEVRIQPGEARELRCQAAFRMCK